MIINRIATFEGQYFVSIYSYLCYFTRYVNVLVF